MKKKVSGNTKSLIISLFAVLSCLTASHASAQTARVTIGMRQVKMEQVMNEIEKQTRYLFIHDKNLDTDRTVSVEVRDRPVAEALEQMVGGTGLTYEINGSNIILSERRGGVGATPDETPQTVAGTVTDSHGLPVIGASVIIKGTTIGVSTDVNGGFELRIPSGTQAPVLLVNYLGYEPQEVAVNGRSEIAVTMQESAVAVENVVVTALGIKRQEKALSYNVQQVKAEDITTVKDANFMNSLNGKVAGVQINASAAGVGGAARVVMRGAKSIYKDNNALYVIDGVPMTNISFGSNDDGLQGNYVGSDGVADINPDDIESISVLTGPSAAALYGSDAANGVVLINTKKGEAGRTSVSFSNSTTFSSPLVMPRFQNRYGNVAGSYQSWGDRTSRRFDPEGFFNTGSNVNNSFTFSTGTKRYQSYFSAATTNARNILPNSGYNRYNFTFRNTFSFLDEKLTADVGASYILQDNKNMISSGQYFNPLPALYLFPRGEDWNYYKNNYEVYDPALNANVHNWVNTSLEQFDNPYWILNRQKPISERNRYEFGGQIKYQIIDGLSVTGRMRYERSDDNFKHNLYASSTANRYPMGRMKDNRYFSEQLYADALVQYNHTWGDFSLNATAGASMMRTQSSNVDLWAEGTKFSMTDGKPNGNVMYPNIFNPANYYANMAKQGLTRKRLNAVFATATFGYKDGLFLDVTARNDWSSTLAFTDSYSFFYPSVGASLLLDRFVNMGSNIDLFKFRASYSIVGNDVPAYMTNPLYTLGSQGAITPPEKAPFRTLEPEKTHSFEAGFDGEFFQHRLHVNATYYKTNTKNQFFAITTPWGTGYRQQYVNAGNVQNQGFELSLGWFQDFGNEFTWSTDLNLSYNDNKIIELVDGLQDGLSLSNFGGAQVVLKEGGHFGDLYVRHVMHDEKTGKMLVTDVKDDKGNVLYSVPTLSGEGITDLKYVGDMNSKVNMGWNNTFRYKDFSLSFLIDFRFGGKVLSMTEAGLDAWGVSQRTADARDKGYVVREGVRFDNVEEYYKAMGALNYNAQYNNEDYVYDATNVRMREISFGYTFRDLFGQSKNLTLSLIARNLFFFYKDAPMDPDVSMGTANGVQGFDIFNLPTTRSFGLNVKLNF